MTELKLNTDEHDIEDLIRYLDGDHHMSVHDRLQVIKALKMQMNSVDEPTEFGSVVQARMSEAPAHSDPMVWIYTPWHGEHYWRSGHGLYALWSELRAVEVLRVGVGDERTQDEAYVEARKEGALIAATAMHEHLQTMHREALGAERKNAIERMTAFVEGLS